MGKRMITGVGVSVCLLFAASALGQTTRPVLSVQAEQGLGAAQYHARALELMRQAEAAYNPDFFDQRGWQQALAYAEAAHRAEPSNPEYLRSLAMGYTQTQYWFQGYNLWRQLEQSGGLQEADRTAAALSAAKLGYLRMMDGGTQEAAAYFGESLRWREQPQVQALLERVQTEASGE